MKHLFSRTTALLSAFFVVSANAVELSGTVADRNGSTSTVSENGRVIDRTNHLGFTVWTSQNIPVKAGVAYCGRMKLDVLSRSIGALGSVRLVLLDANMRPVKYLREAGGPHQHFFSAGPIQVEYRTAAAHGAGFMRFEVLLAGNPSKVRIENPVIEEAKPVEVFHGKYTPKRPYPDREKTLAAMRKTTPATVDVVWRDGRPVIIMDGKEVLFKSYKGSRDYGEMNENGINVIQSFTAGITLFWDKVPWDPMTMTREGGFDFSRLEKELLFIFHHAPTARVLLNVNVDPGQHFFDLYPDSIFRNEAGQLGFRQFNSFAGFGGNPPNPRKHRHYAVSYASEDYQNYVCKGLKALAEFLKSSPAGNIVVGFGFNGGHDDQFLQWEWNAARGQADYSPAALKAYRKWLKEKYRTDKALRKAWGEPAVTFETAKIFSEKEWKSRPYWSSAKNGLDRKVSDGREFITWSIAEMNKRFARALKENMGRRVLVGTYYSSPIWGQTGRSSLHQLADNGKGIDIVFNVSGYSYLRQLGGVGGSGNFAIAAAHSAGLLYMQEMDHRTYRSRLTAGWTKGTVAYPDTIGEFQDQIFRDVGATVASGADGYYHFDMFESWYNDPDILKVLNTAAKAADFSVKNRAGLPRSEVAIFLDEKERLQNLFTTSAFQYGIIARMSGVTPDIYLLDDLTRPLPDYKLWIIPDPLTITDAQLKALKEKAFKKGNVIMISGNAGALSSVTPGRSAPTLAKLGIKVRDVMRPTADFVEFSKNLKEPEFAACSGRVGLLDIHLHNAPHTFRTRFNYFTVLDDPSFKTVGVWHSGKAPAIGIKHTPNGTIIYSAYPSGITSQMIYNAAKAAGVLPHSEPGNTVIVGNGVISVHRMAQEVVLYFDREMEFFDPETGKMIGEGKTLPVPCRLKGSRLINYRLKK